MLLSKIAKYLQIDFDLKNDLEINKLNSLSDGKAGELSFLQNPNYLKDLKKTKVSAVLISKENLEAVPQNVVSLVSQNPYLDLAKISHFFSTPIEINKEEKIPPKIEENCQIDENVFIGSGVEIGRGCKIMHNSYIGDNVKIGENTLIYPNTTIYKETVIEKNVIIHSGSVIGSDGFGFATNDLGEHFKIHQNGNVIIESNVEIGANSTIDRAVFNSTIIRKGVRIDNLVQIGHNCEIGENSVIVSQSGVAGSTQLGRNVVIGGQTAISGHLKIAPFTTISGKTGITKNITKSGLYFSGYPAYEHKQWLKLQAKIAKFFKG
jgi:UDP-3-O-[3-hydroxymyristoyl] glucosamine N-acyltransferase